MGRRTASAFDLNLAGTTGPAPAILAKTGAEKLAGWLIGVAELKFAGDVGATVALMLGWPYSSVEDSGEDDLWAAPSLAVGLAGLFASWCVDYWKRHGSGKLWPRPGVEGADGLTNPSGGPTI
jgi:hypothetical protein